MGRSFAESNAIRLQLPFFEIDSFARAILTSRPLASLGHSAVRLSVGDLSVGHTPVAALEFR